LSSVTLGLLLQLQVSAFLLNLLPVPPLDGFQAIAPWLPLDVRLRLYSMSNQALWILFIAIGFVPPVRDGFWTLVYSITDILGVPPDLPFAGWRAFRFWRHT
jgi:Zn-dependent protease